MEDSLKRTSVYVEKVQRLIETDMRDRRDELAAEVITSFLPMCCESSVSRLYNHDSYTDQ